MRGVLWYQLLSNASGSVKPLNLKSGKEKVDAKKIRVVERIVGLKGG